MVFDQANASHLKPWLVRTLEPICDAEPGALADYILALLKHNAPEPEMRAELGRQLEEFLETECAGFIDTLFTALRTKSYLPYTATPSSPSTKPVDGGIPIPIDVLLPHSQGDRGRKRSNSNDEADGRPSKGARFNHDGQYSRYGSGGSQGWGRPGQQMMMPGFGMPMFPGNGMPQMGGGRRQQGYQPPDQKRGICRDYHNNGYCARGAMCKYSHGEDAVVPGQLYPMNMGLPFMPMFPGGGLPFMPGAAYDPHEARMDMRPVSNRPPRAPTLPRIQQEDGTVINTINASGELPVIQDLTPVTPRDPPDQSQSQQQQQQQPPPEQPIPDEDVDMRTPSMPLLEGMGGGYNPMMGLNPPNGQSYPQPMQDIDGAMPQPGMRPPTLSRGGYRGRGGGNRGRGGMFPDAQGFRPEKRNDKTLVVEKIPEDKLTLEQVNDWFKRFGTVTNVAIDAMTAKALVSFASHQEAHAAWKAEEAVFGNRFVKVFWHRPMEGHGQVGARMLAASGPLVANMGGKPTTPSQPPSAMSITPSATSGTSTPKKPPTTTAGTSATMSALAAKQQKLEETIAEQKTLMAAFETASPEEKKGIMAKLRKLGEEQSKLSSEAKEEAAAAAAAAKKAAPNGVSEKERLEKERLDQELDLHGETEQSGQGESTEDLKAKLEKLKAEAASLGLDSALSSGAPPYRGGYRGRARGAPRGYYRGGPVMRGGPPRGSMKLDNRPKKLLVKGVSEENTQTLRDWYETTGQLESVEPSDTDKTYIVSFRTRSAAEQGLAKGSNIPIVGTVQISWFTGSSSTAKGALSSKPAGVSGGATKTDGGEDTTMRGPTDVDAGTSYTAESTTHEEEIVASGWGGGDEDGDGMGML
ncbi:hypothetical protein CVT24_011312 [Panaeolus cyanescens]|uniref:C3H1-type domain-containing protein n=1 Tax=Panaeolus cyanescens TaxID=181874 RepID=A0A409VLA9_9AGAR|nr:hypothetical protein CVT24_011312 [Panaeolus cyanescens]